MFYSQSCGSSVREKEICQGGTYELKEFRRDGKIAYLDPIRAFLVEAKPEEKVRQAFLMRLLGEVGVPRSAIEVEYAVKKGGGTSRGRADLLIWAADGSALMVIECKEPGTPLHDGVHAQARRYADELGCTYLAFTNGKELETFHRLDGQWRRVVEFPSYKKMQTPRQLEYNEPKSRDFRPFSTEELGDPEFLVRHEEELDRDWGYQLLGADTPMSLWTPIYAFYSALFHQPDIKGSLPRAICGFQLEEYLGLHFTEYGNYAGGKFPGLYASFRVTDAIGDDQIYKIGFFSCPHMVNDPTFGNRKGTSGIHVAIDDFDMTPHMSLELSLDACLKQNSKGFRLVHDGKITVGRLGAAKRDLLLRYVAERAPHLVRGNSVVLGSFPAGRMLTFGDVSDLVFNLLHYAEIRDRFRVDYKASRA